MNGWQFKEEAHESFALLHCGDYHNVYINVETLIPYCDKCNEICPEDILTQAKLLNAWVYDELCRDIYYTGEGVWK